MGTIGPAPGATFASDSLLGTLDWTGASNASVSDNSYATCIMLLGQITRYLKVTNLNLNVPTDATVTGITVNIERSSNTLNATHDNSIKLTLSGSVVGNNKASASQWPIADAVATYGSSSDLWGSTWTPSQVNDPTFGVEISAIADLAGTAQIDYVSITVDYLGSNRATNTPHIKTGSGMSVGSDWSS